MSYQPLWVLADENYIIVDVTDPLSEPPTQDYWELNNFYTLYNIVRVGWKHIRSSVSFQYIPNTEVQFENLKNELISLVHEREHCEVSHQTDPDIIAMIEEKALLVVDTISSYMFGDDDNSKNLLFYFQENISQLKPL